MLMVAADSLAKSVTIMAWDRVNPEHVRPGERLFYIGLPIFLSVFDIVVTARMLSDLVAKQGCESREDDFFACPDPSISKEVLQLLIRLK